MGTKECSSRGNSITANEAQAVLTLEARESMKDVRENSCDIFKTSDAPTEDTSCLSDEIMLADIPDNLNTLAEVSTGQAHMAIESRPGDNVGLTDDVNPTIKTEKLFISRDVNSNAVRNQQSGFTMSLRRKSRRVKSTPIKSWTTERNKPHPSAARSSNATSSLDASSSVEKQLRGNNGSVKTKERGKSARSRAGKKGKSSKSVSRGRDLVMKTLHIPLIDCGSKSPPTVRMRRHTLCHEELASVRDEAKRRGASITSLADASSVLPLKDGTDVCSSEGE